MAKKAAPISPPQLDGADEFPQIAARAPETDAEYLEAVCRDEDWQMRSATAVTFDTVILANLKCSKTKMRDTVLRDVSIARCDLSNADWTGASFRCVEIASTRLTGFNGSEGRYRDLTFRKCNLQHAVFLSAEFERCRFEGCDLSDATLEGAKLDGVCFRDCQLANTRLVGAKLVDVDLRQSDIRGIQLGVNRLQGVTIDPLQAVVIAELAGVRVRGLTQE